MNPCKICETPTKNRCANCFQVSYCSKPHQKQDWRAHRPQCFPFKIEHNEQLGRHLVATRNIKAFEVVLREAPLVRGPAQLTSPVCMGCLNGIEANDHVDCDKCGWPMCSPECLSVEEHNAECELTKARGYKVNVQEFNGPHPLYTCLATVRCLLIGEKNEEDAEKFKELETLEETRRGSSQWRADLTSIGEFIPKFFRTSKFSESEIMRAVGALQINGHEVPTSDPSHVAVFHIASFTEHSCLPNLAKSFNRNGHCVLWAPKEIKRNSHLSICYSDPVWGTAARQRHLMQTKLFKCSCERCIDVTELGTKYSGIKCEDPDCIGLLLPIKVEDWNGNWRCDACQKEVQSKFIDSILDRSGQDVLNIEKNTESCFTYLNHYEKLLPSQHYNLCEVKILLAQLIAKDQQELMAVSEDHLQLKLKYARELIELYEILAPCEVRMLGTLSFELHSAIAEHTRRISLRSNISPKEMLEESLLYVEKCVNYLQYESEMFIEGHILKQAKINRDALRMVLRMS